MNELLKKSASEQRKALLNKEISAVELVNATYERIGEVEDKVKAFNSLTKDTALETAKKVVKLLEALEDYDDVQQVYSNVDIPDEIMNEL